MPRATSSPDQVAGGRRPGVYGWDADSHQVNRSAICCFSPAFSTSRCFCMGLACAWHVPGYMDRCHDELTEKGTQPNEDRCASCGAEEDEQLFLCDGDACGRC